MVRLYVRQITYIMFYPYSWSSYIIKWILPGLFTRNSKCKWGQVHKDCQLPLVSISTPRIVPSTPLPPWHRNARRDRACTHQKPNNVGPEGVLYFNSPFGAKKVFAAIFCISLKDFLLGVTNRVPQEIYR